MIGNKAVNIVAWVVAGLATVSFLGLAFVLQQKTLIDWWRPVAVSVFPSLVVGVFLFCLIRNKTGVAGRLMASGVASLVCFSILTGGFYALNYYKSDSLSRHTVDATIVDKFSEQRTQSRRVSRNHVVGGPKYNVYFIRIELPGKRIKRVEVTAGEYVKARKGQRLPLELEDGFFGVPVIKNLSFPVRKYKRN